MNSVLSYPDRGPWGDSRYRGNCSGYIFRDLFTQLRPKSMCDCMMGSGTSIEVAEEMGIKATGLDLRLGFNALRDPILAALGGEHVDLVVSHPPYGPMVAYSNGVWGSEAHPDDLSHAVDEEDFHSKMQVVMMNQRDATRPGGHYATIIGDLRSKGRYVSYQAEICARMPADELAAILIKQQHNVTSDRRNYARMDYPRIQHEYIVLFKRREQTVVQVLTSIAKQAQQRLRNTWRAIVRTAMMSLGGRATLQQLYAAIAEVAPDRCEENPNFQAKIRQTLQLAAEIFEPTDKRGTWQLKAA